MERTKLSELFLKFESGVPSVQDAKCLGRITRSQKELHTWIKCWTVLKTRKITALVMLPTSWEYYVGEFIVF
jgi:hypothetical protein